MSSGVDSYDYIKDPDAIYRESEARIRAEVDLKSIPLTLQSVIIRLIHACGDVSLIHDLTWSKTDVAVAGRDSLHQGRPILCDGAMTASGIIHHRLPRDNPVICTLNGPKTSALATELKTTRSAAAVDLWQPHLNNAVIAIGNAPTALFRLLELLHGIPQKPAAIFAFPVGFVGAAESKDALIDASRSLDLSFLTLRGRRGGSALAAAAVNSLLGPLSV